MSCLNSFVVCTAVFSESTTNETGTYSSFYLVTTVIEFMNFRFHYDELSHLTLNGQIETMLI